MQDEAPINEISRAISVAVREERHQVLIFLAHLASVRIPQANKITLRRDCIPTASRDASGTSRRICMMFDTEDSPVPTMLSVARPPFLCNPGMALIVFEEPRRGLKMPVSQIYCHYVLEQLVGLGKVVAKRMFGGMGLYHKDVFFAVLDDDQLYFKVDDDSRSDYLSAGMRPFQPTRDGPASKTYHQVPDTVLEDEKGLQEWARRAITAAKKKPRKRKQPPGLVKFPRATPQSRMRNPDQET